MNADPHERSQWIAIGRLLRPQGRHGELLVEPETELRDVFVAGRHVRIGAGRSHDSVDAILEGSWEPTGRNAGRIVVKLAGVNSITEAELLAGRDLLIPAADLPELEEGTWFVGDLVGCMLLDVASPVGRISGVEYAVGPDGRTRLENAAPLLQVAPESAPEQIILVPFVKAWLESVDIDRKTVRMHLPHGLVTVDQEPPPKGS